MVKRLVRVVRGNPWTIAAVAVAVIVAGAAWRSPVAVVLLSGYAAMNSVSVGWYCDRLRDRRRRLQLVLRVLAVLLVPVGLVTTLLSPGGLTISEAASIGSPDERIRKASAATAPGSHHGRTP